MSDLIDRDALREALRSTGASGAAALLAYIAAAPTVRCEECVHQRTGGDACGEDVAIMFDVPQAPGFPDFGCCYFERRQP